MRPRSVTSPRKRRVKGIFQLSDGGDNDVGDCCVWDYRIFELDNCRDSRQEVYGEVNVGMTVVSAIGSLIVCGGFIVAVIYEWRQL